MGEAKVAVIYEWKKENAASVEYSFVIPVFNQQNIIVDNVKALLANSVGKCELILIFDGCTDQSETNCLDFLRNFQAFERLLCLRTSESVFETSADNIGFRNCKGTYWIEVQADMQMKTYGFNYLLSKPCRAWTDVFAVSGRCCHQWKDFSVGTGKLGTAAERPLQLGWHQMDKFYTTETCNRGPLLFVGERLKKLGYLDEVNFVLGDDDHDVMARAWAHEKWINGYVPIEVYSPLGHGSTQKPRDATNAAVLAARLQKSDGGFLKRFLAANHPPRALSTRDIPLLL
jgi:glycosyltransferase involved in cell wall biosynthesis